MKKLILCLLILYLGISADGQDIHFSHIHASPLHLSPSMTGVFDNAKVRLIANSRLQWETFTKGYKTVAASADMKLLTLNSLSTLSGGLQVFADRAGDLNFSTNSAILNIAVQKSFDRWSRNIISVGFQGAYLNHSIDYSKILSHQIERELLESASLSLHSWDIGTGITWFHTYQSKDFFYLGASLLHINQPAVTFFGDLSSWENIDYDKVGKILYRKFVLHGGGKFRLSKNISALPSFILLDQGPHGEIKAGSFIKYSNARFNKKNDYAVYLGAWLRLNMEKDMVGANAIDLSLRIDYQKTILTFSFDLNTAKLTRRGFGLGGPEISVIKFIDWKRTSGKRSKVKCPVM